MIGLFFLVREWIYLRKSNPQYHFDEIAQNYRTQFPDQVWNHLLARKSKLIIDSITSFELNLGFGLDLGCGLVYQCRQLTDYGFNVIGLDRARNLLGQASKIGVNAVNADAKKLPFEDGCLDFVYTIGVIHHLPATNIQQAVFQ